MAQFKVEATDKATGSLLFAYVRSPDAKSMTSKALEAAKRQAVKKGKAKLAKEGHSNITVTACTCVG